MTRDVMRVTDLNVVRLLTDPMKLKLLHIFSDRATTARVAAERLGENVTRLYRHIDALTDAGLLEVVAETPKRGTVERTFRSVARRFEVDHRLFGGDPQGGDRGTTAALDVIRGTEHELARALAAASDQPTRPALLMRLRFRATEARATEVIEALNAWIDSLEPDADEAAGQDYAALVAVYPLLEDCDGPAASRPLRGDT